MRFLTIYLVILLTPVSAENWNVNGKTYHNVVPGAVESDKVHIVYDGGVGSISLASLPPDLQKKFHYDPIAIRAQEMVKEDAEKSDWEKIDDDFLVELVAKVKQETDNAKTSDEKLMARVHQMQVMYFHNTFGGEDLNDSQKNAVKQWAECVVNRQVCIGMPKDLIKFAWGLPDSDTVSTSGDGNDIETMSFSHFSSLLFISGGLVKNITQTVSN